VVSAVLHVEGLRKRFVSHLRGGAVRTVLDGVDLTVPSGACVVVTGPSGSGKSSLLRCVHRTYRPDAGRVVVSWAGDETELGSASDRDVLRARREVIGFATQTLSVTPRVSAVDLVAGAGPVGPTDAAWPDAREAARDQLRGLGLADDVLDAPPATFSGGERQMVNLAIALARPRPLLLLDEVTASLDHGRRRLAIAAIAARKAAGTTLLAVFHDLPDHPDLVDEVVQMRDGRVVAA
jgi:alpha-D-ribose 1-methylphosphonate 5-triphosphate synthase subunit PhnL